MSKTSPINKIPIEILQDIFLLLQYEKGGRSALLAVCRDWRQIINSTSHFWKRIQIVVPLHLESSLVGDSYILARLAERAGSLPLDIIWDIAGPACERRATWYEQAYSLYTVPPETLAAYHEAIHHLLERAPLHRWRSLRLFRLGYLGGGHPGRLFEETRLPLALLSGSFDSLEYLEVSLEVPENATLLNRIDCTAKRLKTMVITEDDGLGEIGAGHLRSIKGIYNRISALISKSPHNPFPPRMRSVPINITHLELEYLPPAPLNSYPNVTSLKIGHFSGALSREIDFPRLVSLWIGGGEAILFEPRVVTFNKLENLVYDTEDSAFLLYIDAPLIKSIRFTKRLRNSISERPSNVLTNFFPAITNAGNTGILNANPTIYSAASRSSSNGPAPNPFYRLRHSAYTLFPPTMEFDVPLNIETLVSVLALYQSMEHLTLSFAPMDLSWLFLKSGLATKSETRTNSSTITGKEEKYREDGNRMTTTVRPGPNLEPQVLDQQVSGGTQFSMIPHLTTLRLNLQWKQMDTNYWTTFATAILNGRKGSCLHSVMCVWSDGNQITLYNENM